jgi:hypothetical protein
MKWELGVKERRRYLNIEWLMPSVDVVGVLERLGIERISTNGDQVEALCPDHHIYLGREQSHPKWTCNIHTGETFCFTEGRGSNLVWTVSRVLDCHPKKAVAFMAGAENEVDISALMMAGMKNRLARLRRGSPKERKPVFGLDDIKRDMENRFTSDGMYQFFIHPPGKRYPTDITRETVNHYRVFQRNWGYYTNRAIIPFMLEGKLEGFCAIDLLGKKNWLRDHPLKEEDDYKKVLYPKGFRSGEYLFGLDDCEQEPEFVILTEGAREVMKLWQLGYTNSVSVLGGNVGDGHMKLLAKKAPRKVILMFDGDEAGYNFTEKAAEKLKKLFSIEKCLLPFGRDPKDLEETTIDKLIKRLV